MKKACVAATPKRHSSTSRGKKSPPFKSGGALALPNQSDLFATVSGLIEDACRRLARQGKSTAIFLFWRIGRQVNSEIPNHQRAKYGQKIMSALATQLVSRCRRYFEMCNLRRMLGKKKGGKA